MRYTVEDDAGRRYVLLKRSAESSLVRDPGTGERRHLPNESLEVVAETVTADTVLRGISDEVRSLVTAVHDERGLALLMALDAEGPTSVRTLLSAYDFCESDLHGLLAELSAAGLIEKQDVAGERGYETTDAATSALERLR